MSTVNVSDGRLANSSHDHDAGSLTAPPIRKLH
jgi:hypothetical protein